MPPRGPPGNVPEPSLEFSQEIADEVSAGNLLLEVLDHGHVDKRKRRRTRRCMVAASERTKHWKWQQSGSVLLS